MSKFKVCMLGAYAVGKTSLVRRYVFSIFSGSYQTTLGVKIDRKSLRIDDQAIDLILWDLAGEDEAVELRSSYLRGAAGALLVVDGTRVETLETAGRLKQKLFDEAGEIPVVTVINKSDLRDSWELDAAELAALNGSATPVFETSAKQGSNVNRAFQTLAQRILEK